MRIGELSVGLVGTTILYRLGPRSAHLEIPKGIAKLNKIIKLPLLSFDSQFCCIKS